MNLKRISTGVNWQKPCIDSGASRGGAWEANLPLFLDQTEARRAEKKFFKTAPPPPPNPYSHPLSQSLDEPLSEGLDRPLIDIPYLYVAYQKGKSIVEIQ